jgi:hypothetical protein
MTIVGYQKRVLPTPLFSAKAGARTIVLLSRTWKDSSNGLPFEATVCTMPDSPAARDWFEKNVAKGDRVGGKRKAAQAGATSSATLTYDAMAEDPDACYIQSVGDCDPPPPVEVPVDTTTREEWTDGPNYPEMPEADSLVSPEDPGTAAVTQGRYCNLREDYPHISSSFSPFAPYTKLIQGKANMSCNTPTAYYLNAALERHRCALLGLFCSWAGVGISLPYVGSSQNKTVIAQSTCLNGNYRVRGGATILDTENWVPRSNEGFSPAIHIGDCPFIF